jgi:hydroxymethylbilane synthase
MKLRIGSRGSDLALWQANHVASRLGIPVDIVVIKTAGDRIQHLSLDKVEGKGFFTKEIEAALLEERVDIAVHSYKDLPTEMTPGLVIAAVPERAPVNDVVVVGKTRDASQKWQIPKGGKVGTSSLRRKAQLRAHRPDVELVDLRGNVPTRFRKVVDGQLDAVVLAEAGLMRLGLTDESVTLVRIDIDDVCPAPAQGALAIQTRADDEKAKQAVTKLHDKPTADCVDIERALLAKFGGGCHLPGNADSSALVEAAHADLMQQGAKKYI